MGFVGSIKWIKYFGCYHTWETNGAMFNSPNDINYKYNNNNFKKKCHYSPDISDSKRITMFLKFSVTKTKWNLFMQSNI